MISEPFVPKAQHEASALGYASLPIVAIPHPVGNLPAADVRHVAEAALTQIVDALSPARPVPID